MQQENDMAHPRDGTDGRYARAAGAVAPTKVSTDGNRLLQQRAHCDTPNGPVAVFSARPDHGFNWPIILVVSEIFGVHEHIEDVCRRFATRGYLAVAPELFTRQGDPRELGSIPEILERIVTKVADAQVMADLDAAASWAVDQGGDRARLAITGFCWGGRITWLYAARNPTVRAGVAWYGRLEGALSDLTPSHPIDVVGKLGAPVLGLYAGNDAGIPVETVQRMQGALERGTPAARHSRIVVYEGAEHAFFADYRSSYHGLAAQDGWARCLAWIEDHGAAPDPV